MWIPTPIYRRIPTLYVAAGLFSLGVGLHSFMAWVSAALFLASGGLVIYLRAIQPSRLRERPPVPTVDQRTPRPQRGSGSTAKHGETNEGANDAEISRWAETGFADVGGAQRPSREPSRAAR